MDAGVKSGLSEKSGFKPESSAPETVKSKPCRATKESSAAGKKGGKSFKFS